MLVDEVRAALGNARVVILGHDEESVKIQLSGDRWTDNKAAALTTNLRDRGFVVHDGVNTLNNWAKLRRFQAMYVERRDE